MINTTKLCGMQSFGKFNNSVPIRVLCNELMISGYSCNQGWKTDSWSTPQHEILFSALHTRKKCQACTPIIHELYINCKTVKTVKTLSSRTRKYDGGAVAGGKAGKYCCPSCISIVYKTVPWAGMPLEKWQSYSLQPKVLWMTRESRLLLEFKWCAYCLCGAYFDLPVMKLLFLSITHFIHIYLT